MSKAAHTAGPTRHEVERKAVDYIKTARGGFSLARSRFFKAMRSFGYNDTAIRQAWIDCWDVALLEMQAEPRVIRIPSKMETCIGVAAAKGGAA
jgi:hypothetical protein